MPSYSPRPVFSILSCLASTPVLGALTLGAQALGGPAFFKPLSPVVEAAELCLFYSLLVGHKVLASLGSKPGAALPARCLRSVSDLVKPALLPICLIAMLILVYLYLITVPLFKLICVWASFFFFLYLLISGFVFFEKRYAYGSFTSIIFSFWKRSFGLFWLLEGFLFIIFIYVTMNSSSEVVYAEDYQALMKGHLFSWRLFFFKLVLLSFINLVFFTMLGLSNYLRSQALVFLSTLVSSLVLYIAWLEFSQFFYFLGYCDPLSWNLSTSSYEWLLEPESRSTRIINSYVLVCTVAKFWHLVFIMLVWFYTMNRILESNDYSQELISANQQNFVILYGLNWISMYPWFKYMHSYYLNLSYPWSLVDFSERGLPYFFSGLSNLVFSVI